MSGKIWFDPTSGKWALSDGEHYLEVPHWAREIIADEFERETRQLKADNDKLREELDDQAGYDQMLRDILCQQTELCIKAEADNAKLRELSSIMLKCIMANERKKLICWECPMHKQFDELRSYCCLEHEAKKLGIGEDG